MRKLLLLLTAAAAWGQPVPSRFVIPDSGVYGSGVNTASITLQAHEVAYVFKIPVAGNLTDVSFSTITVTTFSSASDILTVSLETVTAGAPTGTTYKGAGVKTYVGNVNPLASNVQYDAVLDTQATSVVAGDTVAVRFKMTTFSAASFTLNATSNLASGFPFYARSTDSGSTWTKTGLPKVAVKISGTWYQAAMDTSTPCIEGITNVLTSAIMNNSASTYDQYGMRFQYPCAITLAGFWVKMSSSASSTYDAVLLDASHSVLSTASYAVADALNTAAIRYFFFATPVTLAANTTYTVAISATTASAANTTVIPNACLSADFITAMQGGTQFYTDRRTRVGSTWAPVATERPPFGLIIDSVKCTTSH